MAMSKSDTEETQNGSGSVVQHVLYRVPKRNHDSVLQLCKEANEILSTHSYKSGDEIKWKKRLFLVAKYQPYHLFSTITETRTKKIMANEFCLECHYAKFIDQERK
jgi:hypothetical protein